VSKKLAASLIVFNVVALGLLIKDHFATRRAFALPMQMGGVNGAVVTADEEITTTSLQYVDMPDMAITSDFPGGDLVVTLTAEGFTRSGAEAEIRVLVDGQPAEPGDVTFFSSPLEATGGFTFVAEDIAPGAHTIKAQWRKESSDGREVRIEDRTMLAFTIRP
jgi:hypothetical protein